MLASPACPKRFDLSGSFESVFPGLKASQMRNLFRGMNPPAPSGITARLKPCPDTKLIFEAGGTFRWQ